MYKYNWKNRAEQAQSSSVSHAVQIFVYFCDCYFQNNPRRVIEKIDIILKVFFLQIKFLISKHGYIIHSIDLSVG